MKKEKKKILKRKLAWISLRVFTVLNGILPLKAAYLSGLIFGRMAFIFLKRHRDIAIESLAVAFPELSKIKLRSIARDSFVCIAQSSLEIFYFRKKNNELKNIRIEGAENLDAALKKGKGVVFVTAHFGNFPILLLKLAKQGYPVNVVLRPMRDSKTGEYIQNLCWSSGIKTILSSPRRECVNAILKALRANEIVVILMDQNFGTGGVWVKFFGKLAATPVGPIIFALRANSALVPGYIYRESLGKHCLKIFPEQQIVSTGNKDESVLLNAVKITNLIQSWIIQFPEQWGWIHRRWKSRPSAKVKNIPFRVEKD
ncbi:MAG: lysophospholipid acyltransferase family protein [Candidatus Omnitrophica bacterium]|nr:lysophospholipid acyltransferase family protein [Candidatus Omnitrophota bacterium]